ncbi:hypothetical protein ACFXO2_34655, partial [Streptomyces sp. NPDC059152]|uniref:hypothetical protein n=1 Tax=Streptomyces sp. NPDC059152 TaxID=3346742 RepID=UPI00368D21BB
GPAFMPTADGDHSIETPVRHAPLKIGTTTASKLRHGWNSGMDGKIKKQLPTESQSAEAASRSTRISARRSKGFALSSALLPD